MDRTRRTIAAIATPAGTGGIGIIKISGPLSQQIALRLFRRVLPDADDRLSLLHERDWESHRFYYGHVVDPENLQIIDEVMIVLMRGPRSYTREDVVEIHLHSGPAVLRAVLALVLDSGAVLAEPGEFTKRAFLNGRIDLSQAEGIIDLIHARTEQSRKVAALQVRGDLGERISFIRRELLEILTEFEAAIDFPEDIEDSFDFNRILHRIHTQVIDPLTHLIDQFDSGHFLRTGVKVIIAGRPNVGKSSLMNRLMGKERAIVTPIPGTTRDTIEDNISIRGIPVVLIDTAGIHNSDDPVEQLGIERARIQIHEADLVLYLSEAHLPATEEDLHFLSCLGDQKTIWVLNKADLAKNRKGIEASMALASVPQITVSAKGNLGIDSLKACIEEMCLGLDLNTENPVVPNLRQKEEVQIALFHAQAIFDGLKTDIPPELLSLDLQSALDALGEVIGITFREDILENIFSRFCIGK